MDRFWNKVNIKSKNECWEWRGSMLPTGYGQFSYSGTPRRAHRISYLLTYGNFDSSKYVCHSCDNKKCVNPEHLFLGTQSDNLKDASNKNKLWMNKIKICPSGHAYTKDNTYTYDNKRLCKKCVLDRQRKYRERKSIRA